MEYLESLLKKTGWNALITSVVFAVLGIVLIMNPEGTVRVVSYILGAMFIIVGLYKVVNYISNKGKYNFYNYDMSFGVIAILIGIVTICFSNEIGRLFGILIGISSGANIFGAMKLSDENPDKIIVTVAPDGVDKYMSMGIF